MHTVKCYAFCSTALDIPDRVVLKQHYANVDMPSKILIRTHATVAEILLERRKYLSLLS
jgi:hypothetical protein